MKLYSESNPNIGNFQTAEADDGIWLQDVQCVGNSQATAALLNGIQGGIRKIEVIATWEDAANFAVSLGSCGPRTSVEVWAKNGPVPEFPDKLGEGAIFGSGARTVVVPVG